MAYTINIPETLYTKARSIADNNAQSVDDVIRELLSTSLDNPRLSLPKAEQDELIAFTYLSDATLRTIAREQMPQSEQDTMQSLMGKNNMGKLSSAEQIRLNHYVEMGQSLMLRKAEAIKLLMQRGHQVDLDNMTANND